MLYEQSECTLKNFQTDRLLPKERKNGGERPNRYAVDTVEEVLQRVVCLNRQVVKLFLLFV